MNNRILIIDDEWCARKGFYENLSKEITKKYVGFEIEFKYQEKDDPTDLQLSFKQDQFDAVITDAVLNGKWKKITINKVVEIVDNKTPMAVVSSRWDKTNSQQIQYVWRKPNCRTFLHWRDISADGQIEYAIESIVHMLADNKNLDTSLKLEADEDLRIVHISDLHVKQIDLEKDEDTLQRIMNKAQFCATEISRHWHNKTPALIAFTGDVTHHGSPVQYKMARKWIQHFCSKLGMGDLPSSRILYVPGNHDINLNLAVSSRLKLNIDDDTSQIDANIERTIHEPDLLSFANVPFKNYLTKVCDYQAMGLNIDADDFVWIESRYLHLGFVLYGFNTSQPSSTSLPERKISDKAIGHLGEQIQKIMDKYPTNLPIVIGLGHHSPVPIDEPDGAISNVRDFKEFFCTQGKTHIFLHGHCHEASVEDKSIDTERLVRVGAPSFAQPASDRPENTFRGFNLLTFTRVNNTIKSLNIDLFGWVGPKLKNIDSKSFSLSDNNFKES